MQGFLAAELRRKREEEHAAALKQTLSLNFNSIVSRGPSPPLSTASIPPSPFSPFPRTSSCGSAAPRHAFPSFSAQQRRAVFPPLQVHSVAAPAAPYHLSILRSIPVSEEVPFFAIKSGGSTRQHLFSAPLHTPQSQQQPYTRQTVQSVASAGLTFNLSVAPTGAEAEPSFKKPPPPSNLLMVPRPLKAPQAPEPAVPAVTAVPVLPGTPLPSGPARGVRVDSCDDGKEGVDPRHPFFDQFSVVHIEGKWRVGELVYAVLCMNDTGHHHRGRLGRYGHIERFGALAHFLAAVLLLAYSVVRAVVLAAQSAGSSEAQQVARWWLLSGVFACFLTFSSSAIYHVTTPDKKVAKWTRQLDYLFIYVSIVVGSLADLAAVTRGFSDVPVQTLLDIPLAAAFLALFFFYRRQMMHEDVTWTSSTSGRCTTAPELHYHLHSDGHHSPLRQASSLILATNIFMNFPAAVDNLGLYAEAVLVLQVCGGVAIAFGMLIDNVWVWPDTAIEKDSSSELCIIRGNNGRFPGGCIVNAHAIWHLIAVLGTAFGLVAREIAVGTID